MAGSSSLIFSFVIAEEIFKPFSLHIEQLEICHAVALLNLPILLFRSLFAFRRYGGVLRFTIGMWKFVTPPEDINVLDYLPEHYRL